MAESKVGSGEIEVMVRTHDRARKANVVFPVDYQITQVIRESCDYFGLPDCKNGNYGIRHERTARILDPWQTLDSQEVRSGDIIEIIIEHGEG